jgi:hypothetical protein
MYRGGTVVKVLCYKSEGRWLDSRWCHWNFSLTYFFRSHYGPGVDSASNRNEYRGVRINGSNAGYIMFRGSAKSTGYPLHSPVSPSLPLPFATVFHHISTGLYLEAECIDMVAMWRVSTSVRPAWFKTLSTKGSGELRWARASDHVWSIV